jgi:hypothetical protein
LPGLLVVELLGQMLDLLLEHRNLGFHHVLIGDGGGILGFHRSYGSVDAASQGPQG